MRPLDDLKHRRLADSWIERSGRDAINKVEAAGVLWAPFYHLDPRTGCKIPPSVFLLFHRDRHLKEHRFKCCYQPWRTDVPETKFACSMPQQAQH